MVTSVERKPRKDKSGKVVSEYWQLDSVDQSNESRILYCFHATLGGTLEEKAKGEMCILKVSASKKGDKVYYQIEDVLEIAGTSYKDGKPVDDSVVDAEEIFT